jgi:putative pyruvate formate lyase activating enzyme
MTDSLRRGFVMCTSCPRNCGADRAGGRLGFCKTGSGFEIASICMHRGEEPVISGSTGICNIFFSHCNLQCIYCQNYQISRNNEPSKCMELGEIVSAVARTLEAGAGSIGFVSPSHMIDQMKTIIDALRGAGCRATIVMNTNAYDRRDVIESLAGLVDVYLPDFKYADRALAREYSGVEDYPEVAIAALREMHRQKGSNLALSNDGTAASGLVIRHLILPGHVENSKSCLRAIAEELSPSVHISLMAQYHPTPAVAGHPLLDRRITQEEYEEVLEEFERLGFYRGWLQEPESSDSYVPDFTKGHPFE